MGFGLTFFVPKRDGLSKKSYFNYIGVPMVIFFIMYLVGLLYSTDIDAANRALQNKIPFLIFPFFLPIIFSSGKEQNFSYLKTFAFSGIVYVFLSILRASYLYISEGSLTAFFTQDFYFRLHDSQLILHPTYGSIYFNFLFFVMSIFLIKNTKLFQYNNKLKLAIIIFISFVFIVFSLSKLGFLMLLINVITLLIYYAITKKKIKETVLMFASFILITAGIVYFSPLKIRLEQAYHEVFHGNKNPDDYYMSTGTRIWTWKITKEVINENGFWGIGTGDFKNELEQKYKQKNMQSFQGYDSHQQYLQTTATLGYLGLFALVTVFVLIIFKSYNKNILLFFLGFMYLFWGFTESMFERQSGVLFFVFFVFLIDSLYPEKVNIEE